MSRIKKSVDSQFLIRVIEEKVSPEEKEFFDNWLAESEKNKEEFSTLILLWDKSGSSRTPETPDPDIMWRRIISTLSNPTSPSLSLSSKKSSSIFNKSANSGQKHFENQIKYHSANYLWFRVAIILLLSLGVFYIFDGRNTSSSKEVMPPSAIKNLAATLYTLKTDNGERLTFPLGDGSIVYLNADSKLIYPSSFSDSLREVELIGEAYFTVKHEDNRPFLVTSGAAKIIVTGTEFNIKNRRENVSVVVAEGSVKTTSSYDKKVFTLRRGEMITYSNENKASYITKADLSQRLAWRAEKLAFNQAPLIEVVEEIERYYNLQTSFADNDIKTKTLTGIFNTDSLDKILSIVNLTLDINISRHGNKLVISKTNDE
ncbi:MAG: FecR domain-containing protein [Ignavibacteriaceae bacterium]|nr:FecR domain-containing protein [Ignavibacteriaceae bacterium]